MYFIKNSTVIRYIIKIMCAFFTASSQWLIVEAKRLNYFF